MKKYRNLLLTAVLAWCSLSAWAVKANTTPALITQSDGTQLTILSYGSSAFHWYTTTDGVLLCHSGLNYFVAQVEADGSLTPTAQLAHEPNTRKTAEQQLAMRQDRQKFFNALDELSQPGKSPRNEPVKQNSTYFPHTGSPRVVVILAQFQDSVFIDDDPKAVFEEYLNAETISTTVGNGSVSANYGSVRKYFDDMSFGKFSPQFDVYGPVTLSHGLSYYGEGDNDRMDRFIPEVCQLADDQVDFSQYDANNDGYVDLVYIIYAGYAACFAQNSSDCIWPKSGGFNSGKFDGKTVYRYGVHSELNAYPGAWSKAPYKRINGIGLFCHEFSHCMGLPDIYPTTRSAQEACNPAMEYWDLMDGGEYVKNGYSPSEYTAWEREAMGWMTIDTLTTSGTYTLSTINEEGGKAYRIMNENDATGKEYLLLQNIQKLGWNIPQLGHGLLVMHVDYDENAFSLESNSVNNKVGHSRFTLIPADGLLISSYAVGSTMDNGQPITNDMYRTSHGGDPFPGTSEVTELKDIVMYNGTLGCSLTDIQEHADDNTVSFTFNSVTSDIVNVHQDTDCNGIYYSPDGRSLGNDRRLLAPGLYIMNHRKVLIR